MFGKENDDDLLSDSKKELLNSQFIFYNNKGLTRGLEIYVILNNYNKNKHLLVIDGESTIDYLNVKIIEYFENFPEFKNLSGLKVQNLSKNINNTLKLLPQEGIIETFLNNGDIIYCDLISYETWISTIFLIQCSYFKKTIKIEYKFNKNLSFKNMKIILLRCAIDLFIVQINGERKNEHDIYYVKNIQYKIITNKHVINDNNSINDISIKNLFQFNSEITVSIGFGFFEELIHNEIRNLHFNHANINRLRLIEYNDLTYRELLNDNRFIQERNTIRKIAKNIIKNEFGNKKSNLLFYTLLNKQKVNHQNNLINENKKMSFSAENLDLLDEIDEYENNENEKKKFANMIIILPFYVNPPININSNKNINVSFNRKNIKRGSNQIKIPNNYKTFLIPDLTSSFKNHKNENLLIKEVEEENNNKSFSEEQNDNFYFENENNDDDDKEENEDEDEDESYDFFENSIESKQGFFLSNESKIHNLCNEFLNNFPYEKFYKNLEKKSMFNINKNLFDNIVVPQSREIHIINKDDLNILGSKRSETYYHEPTISINNIKIIIFVSVLFLYFLAAIIVLNLDLFSI